MTTHTPGPWEAKKLDTDSGTPDIYVLGRSVPHHWTGIGTYHAGGRERGNPENDANARLIAAAPELLAACEALGAFARDLLKLVTPEQIIAARLTTRMIKLNDQAYNAIAKAKGERR